MASAGGENNNSRGEGNGGRSGGGGQQAGQPQRIQFTIPIRNIPPGQGVAITLVPGTGGAQQVQGQPGLRVLRQPRARTHIQLVNRPHQEQEEQQQQRLQRQREQEQTRREEEKRKVELQAKLTISQVPEVSYSEDEGSAQLSWKPVDINGDNPPQYAALMYEEKSQWKKEVYQGYETSCTVTGDLFSRGKTYSFGVRASVQGETGKESEKCSVTIPALCPSQPNPPKVANRAKTSLNLRWNAPADNGAAITQYELEWDQCKGDWEQIYCDKAKQYKYNNRFVPGSHAQFRLRACNEVGWSPYSDVLEFSAGAGPPSVPQPPTLTEAHITSLSLQWTPPQNNGGAEITSYKLEMEDPSSGYGFQPVYQGEDLQFICKGLRRVTSYNFRLSATNEKGQGPSSPSVMYSTLPAEPKPPGAPTNKERPTPHSLCVEWQPPTDDGGSPVQSYVLQMDEGERSVRTGSSSNATATSGRDDGGGPTLSDVYTGPETSYKAEGLRPGRKYRFQVCAVTAGGRGKWSPMVRLSTPAVHPSPPSSLETVGKLTQTSVTLQWGFPLDDGGSEITHYTVEKSRGDGASERGDWVMVATVPDPRTFREDPSSKPLTSTTYTVSQLSPGESYQFRIIAVNKKGASDPSMVCHVTTAPGHPEPPTGLEVINVAPHSVQLKWKDSVCHGSAVESYDVQYLLEAHPEKLTSLSSAAAHCTLRNLTSATRYQAKVKAQSASGASEWSSVVSFTTAPSTPSPPSHLNTVSSTPTSLLVAWATPDCNGAPITAYHIELSGGHMTNHMIKLATTETQYTIPDLKPSTQYRYRIQAENACGKGSFSSFNSGSTLPPPPSPPLLSLLSCTHHTLKLSWGKKQNRSITYMLHMQSQGGKFHEVYRGSGVTHRLARLQPDTKYTLKIAAASASGQGVWSDHVTYSTAPSPPSAPTDVELKQISDDIMVMSWKPVTSSDNLNYEAQVRLLSAQSQDFQQVYKGSSTSCRVPISAFSSPYEARVRCCTTCTVNELEEQLWSGHSSSVQCVCTRKNKEEPEVDDVAKGGEGQVSTEGRDKTVKSKEPLSVQAWGVIIFVVLSIVTLILAFVVGKYAM